MIEIQLRQYGVFQEIIHHLERHFLSDVKEGELGLQFDSDQVRIQGFLLQHIALVDIRLDPTKVFEHYHYQCNDSVTIDPNFLALSQALTQYEHDGVVKLLVSTDSIIVLSEQPESVQKCELPVRHADYYNLPDDHYKCILTMPTLKLQEESILNGAIGEICSISANEGAVYLTTMNSDDYSTVTKRILSTSNQPLFKALLMSSENTTLGVADNIPLKLSQPIMECVNTQGKAEHVGDLSYFVAPSRIAEDEEGRPVNEDFEMPEAFSTSREASFQGELIHGKQFADIIKSLERKDYDDIVVECSDTGLRISGMCPSDISLADVVLTKKDFSSLLCDESYGVGCKLQSLAQILRDVNETDVVSLAMYDSLEITVHSAADQNAITVKEIFGDDDIDSKEVPTYEYSATVSMPPSLFRDIVTTLEGRTCEIGITQDGILFSSDNGSLSILKTNDVRVAFKVKRAVELIFDLSKLREFASLDSMSSSTLCLSLLSNSPLRIQFSSEASESTTYLSLYLAPLVHEKGQDCPWSEPPMTAEDELELLHRIHLSEKATISSETKKAKKGAMPKRRRTLSTDRKRPRKKRAPSKKPKKCSKCLETKESKEFLNAELRKTKFAKCIDCTLVSCEKKMFAFNMVSNVQAMVRSRRLPEGFRLPEGLPFPDEGADEEDENAERLEVRALRSLGCERYECPIFFDNKNNIVSNLQASFNPTFPDVTTLLGNYDVVFAFSDCGSEAGTDRYKQRTVHGLLNLTSRHLASTGSKNGLYGLVEMDPTIQDYVEPRGGSFSFAQVVGEESLPSFELPVAIDDYPKDAASFRMLGESTGTISLLARRTATTWNPEENPDDRDERIVSFETLEDAEKLVDRWKKSFLANSWLSNHLSLPPELALKIHEYVAFRPCPAFFFEKNDLWICIYWRRAEQPTMKTILVARRRPS